MTPKTVRNLDWFEVTEARDHRHLFLIAGSHSDIRRSHACHDHPKSLRRAHRALKARAKAHGRSAEAEVRAILDEVTAPSDRPRLGSLLADIGAEVGGADLRIERYRDPREPVDLR